MGCTALCTLLSLSLLLYSLTLSLIGFPVIPLWHTWTTEKELLKDTPAQRFLLEVAPPAVPHSPLQMQLTPSASTVRRDAVSLPFLQLFLAQDLNLPKSNSEWGKINTKCTKDNLATPLELWTLHVTLHCFGKQMYRTIIQSHVIGNVALGQFRWLALLLIHFSS